MYSHVDLVVDHTTNTGISHKGAEHGKASERTLSTTSTRTKHPGKNRHFSPKNTDLRNQQ